MNVVIEKHTNRISAIDQFRGLAIVLMVAANFMGGISKLPSWLKHAPDVGLTAVDLIAPFFIFAIGLTYRISFNRRAFSKGMYDTVFHFIIRFLAIVGIGAVFSAGAAFAGESGGDWGVLQAIGAAGLICLVFIRTSILVRLASGLGILAAYQILLDRLWLNDIIKSTHGGLPGSLGWGAMLILSTVLADLYHDAKHRGFHYVSASVVILVSGIASSLFIPVSKHRVSMSYVLICVGISALLFFLFTLFQGKMGRFLAPLTWWGRNPLFLYILHQMLLGVIVLPEIAGWYSEAPVWLSACQLLCLLGVISWIAWFLYKKKIVISL